MAHSSTFAWKISCMEEPGRLWFMGLLRLSDFTFTFHFQALEKELAAHSSVLAWRIPGTGEPGGLLSMGSHRVGHDWSDLAAAAAATLDLELKWKNWKGRNLHVDEWELESLKAGRVSWPGSLVIKLPGRFAFQVQMEIRNGTPGRSSWSPFYNLSIDF